MNLKPLKQFITCTKFKIWLPWNRSGRPSSWVSLLEVKKYHIPVQDSPFGLSTAPKTFTRVMKPIPLHYWKMHLTHFLYLDDTLFLEESCMWARIDGQRVVLYIVEAGNCTEPCQVAARTNTGIHSPETHIQHQTDDHLITRDKVRQ